MSTILDSRHSDTNKREILERIGQLPREYRFELHQLAKTWITKDDSEALFDLKRKLGVLLRRHHTVGQEDVVGRLEAIKRLLPIKATLFEP